MSTPINSKPVSWLLALGMFVIGTTSLSILGLGPALTRDLAVDPASAGWLVTAFAATFAIAAPLTQFALGSRFAPRKLIIIGAAILAGSLICSALTTSFAALCVTRIASALGGALIAPTSAALAISLVSEDRRGAVLAIVFSGFTLATVGGVPIATWLTLWLGWRGAMAGIGTAAMIFLMLSYLYLPNEGSTMTRSQEHLSTTMNITGTSILLFGTLGMLAAQFVIYALMGELLQKEFGIPDEGLPFAILLFGILGVAGNAAAGTLSNRLGAEKLVWISFIGLACCLVLLTFDLGPQLGAKIVGGCAFMGTLFATPQQTRLISGIAHENHGFALALNSSASYLGIAIGSGIASAIATQFGLGKLPLAALGILAVTAIANMMLIPRKK